MCLTRNEHCVHERHGRFEDVQVTGPLDGGLATELEARGHELTVSLPSEPVYVNGDLVRLDGARIDRVIRNDAAQLFGIKRANAQHELSVLNLEYLLRLDELDIGYLDGYPTNVHWLEDDLKVVHGKEAKSLGRSALRYLNHDNTSTIFGHDHRQQIA